MDWFQDTKSGFERHIDFCIKMDRYITTYVNPWLLTILYYFHNLVDPNKKYWKSHMSMGWQLVIHDCQQMSHSQQMCAIVGAANLP